MAQNSAKRQVETLKIWLLDKGLPKVKAAPVVNHQADITRIRVIASTRP